jgi:hypothetical protein
LESLTERVFTLLELLDVCLQVITHTFDTRQRSLAGERALASIERVSDDLQANVEQFEEREDALRKRFQEAMSGPTYRS